jgi:calcium-dependent protein kinase
MNQSKHLFIGEMIKINKSLKEFKVRKFILTKNNLFYCKNEQIKGVLNVKNVRVEYHFYQNSQNSFKYLVRFILGKSFSEFWIDRKRLFLEWKFHFSKVFIQTDFHEKYHPIGISGKGSFAKVYSAEEIRSGNKCAAKAFNKSSMNGQMQVSLKNEISIMKDVEHPNLVKLFEVHETCNSVYLVMEHLDGGDLFHYLRRNKVISPKEIAHVIKCLLTALVYLEDKGIMHRDIKPQNLMLHEKKDLLQTTIKLGSSLMHS